MYDELNEKITLPFAAIAAMILFAVTCFLFFIIYQRRKNLQFAERGFYQQTLLQTQIEIQQQTLHNISQEIHDHIGQMLSLIKLNLGRAVIQGGPQYPAHGIVADTLTIANTMMNDLRHLSKGLNADFVEQMGLQGCLEYELERLQNSGQFQTAFTAEGPAAELPLSKAFVLYRVAQECFNNIIKHAKASRITVTVQYQPQAYTITIIDDGIGFDTAVHGEPGAAGGLGLRNMQQRMALVGGRFECESSPGRGTRSVLVAPADNG